MSALEHRSSETERRPYARPDIHLLQPVETVRNVRKHAVNGLQRSNWLFPLPLKERTKMYECTNCGSTVTAEYVRVFEPDEQSGPRVCPRCPDRVRVGASYREAHGAR